MKTIRQIADELGITKQAVRYRLEKMGATKENGLLSVNKDGLLSVTKTAEKQMEQAFEKTNRQNITGKEVVKDRQKETENEALKIELSEKNKQIEELLRLLDQSQKLQMIAEQKLIAIEDKQNKKRWWQGFKISSS